MGFGKTWITPYAPFTSSEVNEITYTSDHYGGGEGPEHKRIKDYIFNHPETLDIKNVLERATEYPLPSGDKLDVYFKLKDGSIVAVEVKSSISDDADITRGIFQSVKYKAVLEAMQRIEGRKTNISAILATGRFLSDIHNRLATTLSVKHELLMMEKYENSSL